MNSSQGVRAALDRNRAAEGTKQFHVVDLGPFDNNRNDVLALNDVAQCAGVCLNVETGRIEAFRQENGARRMLGTLGGAFSIARDLNNQGDVVGGSLTKGDEKFHGFLYRNNQLLDLNNLLDHGCAWEVLQALGINNFGEILAIGCHNGQDRIVLLRPKR